MVPMKNESPILKRILELMEKRGVNAKQVSEALHLSPSSFTDWKKGKANPQVEALSRMAPYFGVSLDYLITGHEYSGEKTPVEDSLAEVSLVQSPYTADIFKPGDRELLSKFRQLPSACRVKTLIYIDGMLAALPLEQMTEVCASQSSVCQ